MGAKTQPQIALCSSLLVRVGVLGIISVLESLCNVPLWTCKHAFPLRNCVT